MCYMYVFIYVHVCVFMCVAIYWHNIIPVYGFKFYVARSRDLYVLTCSF